MIVRNNILLTEPKIASTETKTTLMEAKMLLSFSRTVSIKQLVPA